MGFLRYNISGAVATITIDHPPVNAFNPPMHRELYGILEEFLRDQNVRVGILTAAGSRAFCAGDDIKSPRPNRTTAEIVQRHLNPKQPEVPPEYPGWEAEVQRLSETRFKPIIAAVNGPVFGQGLIYLLHLTDLRIATPNARFGLPEIAYGMGGASGVTRLGRQIPHLAALWLALTGEPFSADEALRNNLINEIVAPEKLVERANEIAQLIARHPPLAVRVEMEAYYRAQDMSRDQASAFSGHLYRLQRAAIDPTPPLAKR
jgi:enoyl-CoA hydratase/carnithine racemase